MRTINMMSGKVGTLAQWLQYRRVAKCRTWQGAMRHYAAQHGSAICMRCDDSAFVVYRHDSRKSGFSQETIPAKRIKWESNGFNAYLPIQPQPHTTAG